MPPVEDFRLHRAVFQPLVVADFPEHPAQCRAHLAALAYPADLRSPASDNKLERAACAPSSTNRW